LKAFFYNLLGWAIGNYETTAGPYDSSSTHTKVSLQGRTVLVSYELFTFFCCC